MKSYVISVSYGKGCYRHIQISATATLQKLHQAILEAYGFDDDHAHAFFMDNHYWSHGDAYFSMKTDEDDRLTKSYKLERFRFQKGTSFKYLFDYGDEWQFQCKVLRELEEETKKPMVVRSIGESPEQYPQFDEDDWDDEDDEDDWEDMPFTPEELEAIYDTLPLEEGEVVNIRRYFDAASRFYGIIRLDKLYEIYNSQNEPVSAENFLLIAGLASQEEHQYLIDQCGQLSEDDLVSNLEALEVTSEYLYYENVYEDRMRLRHFQGDKPFKILPKEEFLRYEDSNGHPAIPENQSLLKFLRRKKAKLTQTPETLCYAAQNLMMLNLAIVDIVEILVGFGLEIVRKTELPELVELLEALDKVTPKHIHRGHTPDEMAQLRPKTKRELKLIPMEGQSSLFDPDESTEKTVLPLLDTPHQNSPCPCGSGRKYKNCCGRLQ